MSDTKKIIELTSGSILDTSQGYIGDNTTGALTRTSYRAMKDFFTAGISASLSSSLYNPAQLNLFSSSVLLFTGSIQTQVNNVFASESNYLPTASYNSFSSSYHSDSASFDTRINNVSSSLVTVSSSLNILSGSVSTQSGSNYTKINNVFASESKYLLTSSFNAFTGSLGISSNTYIPTYANVSNTDLLTNIRCMYSVNGNVMSVTIAANVRAVATGSTSFTVTLPVASSQTHAYNCGTIAVNENSGGSPVVTMGYVFIAITPTVVTMNYIAILPANLVPFLATFQYTITD